MIFHSRSSGRSFTEILDLTYCISYWFASSESYLNAFKGDFKLEWILEVAWVVQDNNITYVDLSGQRIKEQNKNSYLGHGHKWAPASVRGLWKLWFMFLQIQVDERCCKEDTVAYVKFWLMCQFKNTERQVSVNLKNHDIVCTSGIGIYSMICDHICHTSRKMSMILSVCSPTRCFRKFTWHFLQKKMFLIRSWS